MTFWDFCDRHTAAVVFVCLIAALSIPNIKIKWTPGKAVEKEPKQ